MKCIPVLVSLVLTASWFAPLSEARPMQIRVKPGPGGNWSKTYAGPSIEEHVRQPIDFADARGINGKLYAVLGMSFSFGPEALTVIVLQEDGSQVWSGQYLYDYPDTIVRPVAIRKVPDALVVVALARDDITLLNRTLILKLSPEDGCVLSSRILDCPSLSPTGLCDIQLADVTDNSDGSLTAAGRIWYYDNGYEPEIFVIDILLLKLTSDGDIMVQSALGRPHLPPFFSDGEFEGAARLSKVGAYEYVITGHSSSSPFTSFAARIGPGPTITWQKAVSVEGDDYGDLSGLCVRGDEVALVGTRAVSNRDAVVVSLSATNGSFNGAVSFGGSVSGDSGDDIDIDEDGDYVVSASTYAFGAGSSDAWLLRVDSIPRGSGSILRQVAMGGSDWDAPFGFIKTSSGKILLSGIARSFSSDSDPRDIWLIKTDSEFRMDFNSASGGQRTVTSAVAVARTGSATGLSPPLSINPLLSPLESVRVPVTSSIVRFPVNQQAP